mgnify:CR=1 FL=1
MGIFMRGKDWYVDYYFDGRRTKRKIGPSKALAKAVLMKAKTDIVENKYLDIRNAERVRFEDFADEYLEVHSKVNNRSWKQAELHNINRLKAKFGGKYLNEIRTQDVSRYKAELRTTLSAGSSNRVIGLMKSIYNKAIAWGKYSGINPARGVKFYREEPRTRFLEKEEIAAVIDKCKEPLRSVVIVAVYTGMRRGEIINLKWHDIDIKRGVIHLYHTKNNESRDVPMNDVVRKVLIRQLKHPESPYVFTYLDGRPYRNADRQLRKILKALKIEDFRFHDLRHTFASQLVMSGVDLNTTRELLGHKTMAMTIRYSHLSQDHKKRAVEALSANLVPIRSPEPEEKKDESAVIHNALQII